MGDRYCFQVPYADSLHENEGLTAIEQIQEFEGPHLIIARVRPENAARWLLLPEAHVALGTASGGGSQRRPDDSVTIGHLNDAQLGLLYRVLKQLRAAFGPDTATVEENRLRIDLKITESVVAAVRTLVSQQAVRSSVALTDFSVEDLSSHDLARCLVDWTVENAANPVRNGSQSPTGTLCSSSTELLPNPTVRAIRNNFGQETSARLGLERNNLAYYLRTSIRLMQPELANIINSLTMKHTALRTKTAKTQSWLLSGTECFFALLSRKVALEKLCDSTKNGRLAVTVQETPGDTFNLQLQLSSTYVDVCSTSVLHEQLMEALLGGSWPAGDAKAALSAGDLNEWQAKHLQEQLADRLDYWRRLALHNDGVVGECARGLAGPFETMWYDCPGGTKHVLAADMQVIALSALAFALRPAGTLLAGLEFNHRDDWPPAFPPLLGTYSSVLPLPLLAQPARPLSDQIYANNQALFGLKENVLPLGLIVQHCPHLRGIRCGVIVRHHPASIQARFDDHFLGKLTVIEHPTAKTIWTFPDFRQESRGRVDFDSHYFDKPQIARFINKFREFLEIIAMNFNTGEDLEIFERSEIPWPVQGRMSDSKRPDNTPESVSVRFLNKFSAFQPQLFRHVYQQFDQSLLTYFEVATRANVSRKSVIAGRSILNEAMAAFVGCTHRKVDHFTDIFAEGITHLELDYERYKKKKRYLKAVYAKLEKVLILKKKKEKPKHKCGCPDKKSGVNAGDVEAFIIPV